MRTTLLLLALGVAWPATVWGAEQQSLVIVVGAGGSDEFGVQFRGWAERWQQAAARASAQATTIGLDPAGETSDREAVEELLSKQEKSSTEPLWIVLLGHGTFDGKTAKFNLRGPDFTPAELNGWLRGFKRPLAVVHCGSSSGPFVAELSAPNRVVVAATKSGFEYNFARFGDYLSSAIVSPKADLDKDEQTSLLEAVLLAASQVREFYETDARLATEHAILDDNGDKLGTPADWFQGLKPMKAAAGDAALDGALAAQFVLLRGELENQLSPETRARRDELERQLAQLRSRKNKLGEAEYFTQLEPLLVEIARLYASEKSISTPAGDRGLTSPARQD